MRHLLIGLVVAATTVILPAFALAGNQETATKIAQGLRDSGQLQDYKIGVKYQDGTAWLRGRVSSEEQLNTALKLVFENSSVERVVNNLTIDASESTATIQPTSGALAPERIGAATRQISSSAQRVAASFNQAKVQPVSAVEAKPIPRTPTATTPGRPLPVGYMQAMPMQAMPNQMTGAPMPAYVPGTGGGVAPAQYDQPNMPNYAWPSYAAYPNYAALTYPRQHSPAAWPFIGPFYPYPQVPLGWRKVTLEWDDGWWMLDFKD